jgi:hypothetical protein
LNRRFQLGVVDPLAPNVNEIPLLETEQRLRLKPAPPSWGGKCRSVYNSRKVTRSMRRRLIELRLAQLASQQASSFAKDGDTAQDLSAKRGRKAPA